MKRLIPIIVFLVLMNLMLWIPQEQETADGLMFNRYLMPPFSIFILIMLLSVERARKKAEKRFKDEK